MSIESIQRLGRAYYAIPAGEPSTEQVLEQLPDLYAAIEELLTETDQYSGLLAALGNAREQGYPIHVATRTTCAEHIEQGDDKRDNFAFASRASPRRPAMSDFDPRIFDDERAVAWLAGAFAGFLLRKPWKVDDEESTIRENRADVREAIQHALNNPEWVERSLEISLSQSVDLKADHTLQVLPDDTFYCLKCQQAVPPDHSALDTNERPGPFDLAELTPTRIRMDGLDYDDIVRESGQPPTDQRCKADDAGKVCGRHYEQKIGCPIHGYEAEHRGHRILVNGHGNRWCHDCETWVYLADVSASRPPRVVPQP